MIGDALKNLKNQEQKDGLASSQTAPPNSFNSDSSSKSSSKSSSNSNQANEADDNSDDKKI